MKLALIPLFLFGFALAAPKVDPAPPVYTVDSRFERVVVVRLKNKTDILEGLKQAVAREKIRNAVILSGFGSVTNYHVHVVANTTFPPKNAYLKENGPFDILTVSGMIMNGNVHPHISLASTTKTVGGHLEPGTNVFTFAVISIGVVGDAANLSRVDDFDWR